MEDKSRSENLEKLLAKVNAAMVYSSVNQINLDNVMKNYWVIVKELNAIAPAIFNNLATNGIIDLINRSNLVDQAKDEIEKSIHYKDYWDYLSHSIKITIDYINNYLPEKIAVTDVDR